MKRIDLRLVKVTTCTQRERVNNEEDDETIIFLGEPPYFSGNSVAQKEVKTRDYPLQLKENFNKAKREYELRKNVRTRQSKKYILDVKYIFNDVRMNWQVGYWKITNEIFFPEEIPKYLWVIWNSLKCLSTKKNFFHDTRLQAFSFPAYKQIYHIILGQIVLS